MIQKGSCLSVIDNSGAKKVYCINVYGGFKKRYATIGDVILVVVKRLRKKRRLFTKVDKGALVKALIVRTKVLTKASTSGRKCFFFENSVVLLTKQNKPIGTRIFGVLLNQIRFSRFLRLASLSRGCAS